MTADFSLIGVSGFDGLVGAKDDLRFRSRRRSPSSFPLDGRVGFLPVPADVLRVWPSLARQLLPLRKRFFQLSTTLFLG